jgi:hypothetical protein
LAKSPRDGESVRQVVSEIHALAVIWGLFAGHRHGHRLMSFAK